MSARLQAEARSAAKAFASHVNGTRLARLAQWPRTLKHRYWRRRPLPSLLVPALQGILGCGNLYSYGAAIQGAPVVCRSVTELVSTDVAAPMTMRPPQS